MTSITVHPTLHGEPNRDLLDDHVVLVDRLGRPVGLRAKHDVHSSTTPLHLAFSCYLVRPDAKVLLTRRATSKTTWPGVWTNACCGHPRLGESLRTTVTRRIGEELALRPTDIGLVLADFVYRAEMDGGLVEHELCPVLAAVVDGDPSADPDEVDDHEWVDWSTLMSRVADHPESLSPWCVWQVARMAELGWTPEGWLRGERFGVPQLALDVPNDDVPACEVRVSSAPSPLDIVGESVDPILRDHLRARAQAFAGIDEALTHVVNEVQALVAAGGKRLRPAFVYWGHRATGADHDDAALHVAAAMELLHTFALLHDDVMDRSATRRNRPTASRAMADEHRGSGRTGDSEWFGASAAILAGDLTFVWADEVLHAAPMDHAATDRCRHVFDELRTEVLAGQFLDLLHAGNPRTGERAAAKVALLKSARYTVTRPLLLGAALADPADVDPGLAATLTSFGDAVGLAFQLRDDVLGMFGDPMVMGKSDLDDLREGKTTLLVVRARQLSTPAQRAEIDRRLGDPELDESGADVVREVVAATGALASIETLLRSKHAAALEALEGVPEPGRRALSDLAALAVVRQA